MLIKYVLFFFFFSGSKDLIVKSREISVFYMLVPTSPPCS